MSETRGLLQAILERINVLIALQLESLPEMNGSSLSMRIRKLAELGLSPSQIGTILGKKANYVSAVLGGRGRRSHE